MALPELTPKCDLILVAGGSGARFQSLKQFEDINGKATYLWFLETFRAWPQSGNVVVVVPEGWEDKVKSQVKNYSTIQVVKGGSSRQASATAGFQCLEGLSDSPWVMVHDAARPCASMELIERVWQAREKGAVIPGLPVRETIKEVKKSGEGKDDDLVVCDTPRRENLYSIQTPQLFNKKILKEAYEKFPQNDAADDASLVEKLGLQVIVVPGEYDNLKITFREDIERVSNWLRK